MEDKHTSRSSRRGGSSSGLSILLLLLLLINTLGLGYIVYRTYQSDNTQNEFKEQVSRLETEIDKLGKNQSTAAAANTTTPSSSQQQSTAPETSSTQSMPQTSVATDNQATEPSASDPAQEQEAANVEPQEQPSTYVVQAGDALSLIAEQHGLSLEELMQKNNLSDTTVLVGTELTVR